MASFPAYGGPRRLDSPSGSDEKASAWRPLSEPLFLSLWIAALASNIGTWMQNVGAAWLMTSLSSSALMVALIQTASSLPIFLLALPAGALADVVDRRRLLLFSQAWMLVAAGLLGTLTLSGTATPVALLVLSFALGVGAALNAPAWQAIVPEVVAREDLANAIALNGINFNIARAIGPALGGLVISLISVGATFILNALSFLGVMIVLHRWKRVHNPGLLPAERVVGAMRAGLRYLRYAPPLRAVLLRTAAFIIGGSAMWAILPLVARYQLDMKASGYGVLLGCFGAGAVGGGAYLPRLSRRLSTDLIVAGTSMIFALVTAELAIVHNSLVAYLTMALGGASWVVVMAEINVAAQLAVPLWVQGRALSCYQIVVQGGMALGALMWGAVAQRLSVRVAMLGAAGAIVIGIFSMLRYRLAAVREMVLDPLPAQPPPRPESAISNDSGPVLVTVEYAIDPAQAAEFEEAMLGLRTIRLRDGAVSWGLFFDVTQLNRYVEYFVVDSWVEHLRQHGRATVADLYIRERVRRFQRDERPPIVSHQLAAQSLRRK
jgi:MFS family permease